MKIEIEETEEVSKACFAAGKQITAWLLPDVRSHAGVAHGAEFPLYVALFVQGLFAKKKKLTCTPAGCPRTRRTASPWRRRAAATRWCRRTAGRRPWSASAPSGR
jgi:hypothetical protein